jgi:hypothetical protein
MSEHMFEQVAQAMADMQKDHDRVMAELTAERDHLRAELDEGRAKRAEAAVSAVLALHWARGRDYPFQSGDLVCMGCATKVTFTSWPCATVRAIDAAFFGDKQ